MKNPWVTAIPMDLRHRPKDFHEFPLSEWVLRPLTPGARVFLYDAREGEPAYGQLAKVTSVMKVNDSVRVSLDLGKKKK